MGRPLNCCDAQLIRSRIGAPGNAAPGSGTRLAASLAALLGVKGGRVFRRGAIYSAAVPLRAFPRRGLKRWGRLESVNGVGGEGRQGVRAPDPVAGKPIREMRKKHEAENDQHDA